MSEICTVSGTIRDLGFDPEDNARIVITLKDRRAGRVNDAIVIPEQIVLDTNEAGEFEVDLVPGRYRAEVFATNGNVTKPIYFNVDAVATARFEDLIDAPLAEPVHVTLQAAADAQAARDQAVTAANDTAQIAQNVQNATDAANAAAQEAQQYLGQLGTALDDAAASATDAATQATQAAQEAAGAQTARIGAETAQTGAETARTGAETAKGDAETAATTATSQATLAASSEADAEAAAAAAAASATDAATSATQAAQEAAEAQTARIGAEAAQTGAETALAGATAAKGDAETAATTATSQATLAASSEAGAEAAAAAAATSATDAATSATQAAQEAAAAQTARTGAETAQSAAETAQTAASGAQLSAESAAATATNQATLATSAKNDADSAATAAGQYATNASASASQTALDASAANSSKVQAETARAGAVVAQTAAVTAQETAEAAAASAETQAGLAVSAKNAADSAATAATNQAASASASATQASQDAQAAQNERIAAETARSASEAAQAGAVTAQETAEAAAASATASEQLVAEAETRSWNTNQDPTFTAGLDALGVYNQNSLTIPVLTNLDYVTAEPSTDPLYGGNDIVAQGAVNWGMRQMHPVVEGRTWRLKARAKLDNVVEGVNPRLYFGVRSRYADGVGITNHYLLASNYTFESATVVNQWVDFEVDFTSADINANAAYFNLLCLQGYASSSRAQIMRVSYFELIDVTEQAAANTYAASAQISADSAVSASTTATGAAASAQDYRDQTAQIMTDAEGELSTIQATIQQHSTTLASYETGASASYVLRVLAGGAAGTVALSAWDDESGEGSNLLIDVDNLDLVGKLNADWINAGIMNARHLEVTEVLKINAVNAALTMGKLTSLDETNDGIYLGRHQSESGGTGFAFHAGRTNADGLLESISISERGFDVLNANFYRDFAQPAAETQITDTTAATTINLDPTTAKVSLDIMGGGGGGAGGGQSAGDTSTAGGNGGATTVQLRDGTTVIQTWTANGGAGGAGVTTDTNKFGHTGQSSAYGTGGDGGSGGTRYFGGATSPTAGGAATGYSAGGGGGGSFVRGGIGGEVAPAVSVSKFDVSGLTSPNLLITVGAGGNSGLPAADGAKGGSGAPGLVVLREHPDTLHKANVIPLEPTSVGTMSSRGPFPPLGAGMWIISSTSNTDMDIARLEINDTGETLQAIRNDVLTIISSRTPTITKTNRTERSLKYQFFPME